MGSDLQGPTKGILAKEESTSATRKFFLDRQRFFLNESLVLVDNLVDDGLRSIRAPKARVFGILLDQGPLLRTVETLEHMDIYQTLNLADSNCQTFGMPVLKVVGFSGPVSSLSVVVVPRHDVFAVVR
ncbi:hypothetical protein HG530_003433 [Fusarium avenaceum]|nr:hypothetical protein HG530_003433 [Fusarium avenaceum]